VGGGAAIGIASIFVALLVTATATSATPGAQATPSLTPDPVATATSPFTLSVPGNAFCDNTGAAGWRAHTFIVNTGVDVSSLAFDNPLPGWAGADFDASDGTIAAPLFKADSATVNIIPATTPAGLIDPSALAGFSFDPSFWTLADGSYQIGFACLDGPGVVKQWWSLTVNVDADAQPNPFISKATPPTSTTSTTIKAQAVPGKPSSVIAKPLSTTSSTTGSISVSYKAPTSNGGSKITKFTATCVSSTGGATKSGTFTGSIATAITVKSATLKRKYTCTVKATNGVGTGSASAASPAITVGAPLRVGKPTVAKVASRKLRVSFTNLTSAQTNGSALSTPKYTATCTSSNGGAAKAGTATKSPVYVSSLSAGKRYTCTVKAHNARGYGRSSDPSDSKTA
jgi:hypothetical protein